MQYLSDLKHSAQALRSEGRGTILFAIAAGWFLSIGVRLIYPVLLPYLQAAYGLTLTTAGFLLTVLWLAYALGQLPGGLLADRFGEGTILVVSTLLSVGTLIVVITANSALVLFIATALFGAGTALYGVVRLTSLSELYPKHDGAAIGVTMAAGEVGNAVLPLIAGGIAAIGAWQYGFGFTVPLFALVAGGLWMVVPARTSGATSAVDTLSVDAIRHVLVAVGQPTVMFVVFIQILTYCIWQAFTGFYPTYLIEVKGLAPPVATGVFSLFFALGIVVQPLIGGSYDRIGIRRALPAVMGVVTVALALVPFLEGFWPIVAGTVLLSMILGYGTITLPYLTSAMPKDIKNTGLGTVRMVYMTIGAVSPTLFGALAGRGLFDEGFLVLSVIAGVTVLLSLRIPEG